jgi:hypothetical protein
MLAWVTKLGEFSPLGSFFENDQSSSICGGHFSPKKVIRYCFKKMLWAIFWAIFFKQSSGRPDAGRRRESSFAMTSSLALETSRDEREREWKEKERERERKEREVRMHKGVLF